MAKHSTTAEQCAGAVSTLFDSVFHDLESWRDEIALIGPKTRSADLDALVQTLVVPSLTRHNPTLLGAGFIAAPEFVRGRDVHFSWWIGPLESNPLLGITTVPTRLDLGARIYTEYLRDVRKLEWYSIPESTQQRHVTGPYVDHLCTCDYLFTVTIPVRVDEQMVGVVGADISVRRLETALLPLFLGADRPLALVNIVDRVVISTEPTVQVGQLAPHSGTTVACSDLPFRVLVAPALAPRV
ncbi:cache domain-containing protein [Cryobacterium sp. PH31-O1]|uniref:cache domain-containing protein n=1 Tax=Cryobacterium sp. PH31-O1 TaxID=3046306 RepID=UPI0024BA7934|nr:cache domain-containing protein [Cryobacterium sp. PH31-O1]MDJ0338581.1 cache domain-containing protein [Cryobacterium sp. PH31-O1]